MVEKHTMIDDSRMMMEPAGVPVYRRVFEEKG
jgi:hypothetical protein